MVAQFISSLEPAVSKARLEAYRRPLDTDLDMVVNYFFNLELSEALYPTLQAFEIALRNSIHSTLSARFSNPFWFDNPNLLLAWQLDAIRKVREGLTSEGKPHDADRIVAQLHFGFWHSMLNRPYEAPLWHANGAALIATTFNQLPRHLRKRQTVWKRCDDIRKLRNRVFHYEPIWTNTSLATEHRNVLEGLHWISVAMHDAIAMCDRFEVIHSTGRANIEAKINAYLDESVSYIKQ